MDSKKYIEITPFNSSTYNAFYNYLMHLKLDSLKTIFNVFPIKKNESIKLEFQQKNY